MTRTWPDSAESPSGGSSGAPTTSSRRRVRRGGSQRGCRQATAHALPLTDTQPERSRPQRAPTLHGSGKRERPLEPSPSGPEKAGAADAIAPTEPSRRQPQ
ncbi:MAG: hypothetical protein OXG81_00910 [Acidobacteria bacterium]|nr:hypothetical protein [Acidobacteriota bacterium]